MLATPHSKHRAQVEAIAAAGKHIYCEKPFALSKADAQAMLDAVKRAGVVIGVGHHFRLMPSMRVLAELKGAGPSAPSCMSKAITATIGWRIIRLTAGACGPRKAAPAE